MSIFDSKNIQAQKDAMFSEEVRMNNEETINRKLWTDELRVELALEIAKQEMDTAINQENEMSISEIRSNPMKSVRLSAYADGVAAAISYFSLVDRLPKSFRVKNALKSLIKKQQDLINESIVNAEDPKDIYEYKEYLESLLERE